MEISIVILSCVILGLNPEMPVFIRLIMICNLNGFRQIKYIHTYIRRPFKYPTEHCRTGEDPHVSAALECSVAFHAILIN